MLILEDGDLARQFIDIYHNGSIHALWWLIVFDILSGLLKSFKLKVTSSSVGMFGVAKHILIFGLIIIMNVYLPLFNFELYSDGFTVYMIIIYLISLAENWGDLGLPLPNWVKDALIKLKDSKENILNMSVEHMDVKETKTIKGEDHNE